MKESTAIKLITKKLVNRWKYLLGIEEWDIKFRYSKLEEDTMGVCMADPQYKKATIIVDIAEHKNNEELLDTIRHEMLHIIHAEFELYREMIKDHVGANTLTTMDTVFELGAETVVRRLEGLLRKLDVNLKGYYE